VPDYLTQRNGYWQFQRRVPLEFTALDKRGIIRHSTKVAVEKDRRAIKAGKIAETLNRELEAYWSGLSNGKAQEATQRYSEARRRARVLGFDYTEVSDLAPRPTNEVLERIEKLVTAGLVEDAGARAALLGREKKPSIKLSELFPTFETFSRSDVNGKSPDQIRRWKNAYTKAIAGLISVVGDKDLTDLSHDDILDYVEWLENRVEDEDIVAVTANKQISHNSSMFTTINRKLRLGLPSLFSRMQLSNAKNDTRPPFPTEFVQGRILSEGALMGINDEARRAIFLIADTGLRLSEAVNLNKTTIFLDCDIPYVRVIPDGRHVKNSDSVREIPLVGCALAAMQLQPKGFPRYVDKGGQFSETANAYLQKQNLRPTRKHTVYSLRHTFKDRLIAAKQQDSIIEALMGHADDHPKYGSGPSLSLKQEVLQRIAFTPPATL
jgi:integrase